MSTFMAEELTPHQRAIHKFLQLLSEWLPAEEERSAENYSQAMGVFLTEGGVDLSSVGAEEGVSLSLLQCTYFKDILTINDVTKVKEELGDRATLSYFLLLHRLMETHAPLSGEEKLYGNLSPGEVKKRQLSQWLSSSKNERLALCQHLLELAWENKGSPVEWLVEFLDQEELKAVSQER